MELPVLIEKVIYKHDKGFAILATSLNPYSSKYEQKLEDVVAQNTDKSNYNNFPVTVNLIDPNEKLEGRQVIVVGEFIKHQKFGRQFKAEHYYSDMPANEDGLMAYLQYLPNIKKSRSKDIIKTFGVKETIRILDEDPTKLLQINGITEKRLAVIKEAWDRDKALRDLSVWLAGHGIPAQISKKIYSRWGEDSLEILTNNPYKLVELKNFGFVRADQIAHKIFKEVPKDLRMVACMKYCLEENLYKHSNLCMPFTLFKDTVIAELKKGTEQNDTNGFLVNEYRALIGECIKKNLNIFVAVKNVHMEQNSVYVYLKDVWEREKYIAEQLYHRRVNEQHDAEDIKEDAKTQFECTDKDLEEAEKDIEIFSGRKIVLDDCQKDAIASALNHKLTIITGGGGTGKSTICRCIFHLAEEKGLSVRMMSPTGKASKVLGDKTGYPAETIHRSLGMKPGDEYPSESIAQDIIIIDEVSMVGLDTMFAIMHAMEQNTWGHLIFVGDCNQLPSISPGNFLFDMMESGCVNVVKLDKIHRQDEKSYIPLIANDIAKGKIAEIPEDASDIKWHSLSTMGYFDISFKKVIEEYVQENDINNLQIISPMYKGEFGINKINEIVQGFIAEINGVKDNPFIHGFATYYIGDRVIQTENNYNKSIFNGDIGTVVEAGRKAINPEENDQAQSYVVVDFYGNRLLYINDEIEELKLAWCISVHRFQGSQAPNIIFIMSREASIMVSKEILYTGITRAERRVDIYGHLDMFRLAPTKSAIKLRYTNMNNIIKELRESRKILKVLE